jgi:hypothetical protein
MPQDGRHEARMDGLHLERVRVDDVAHVAPTVQRIYRVVGNIIMVGQNHQRRR